MNGPVLVNGGAGLGDHFGPFVEFDFDVGGKLLARATNRHQAVGFHALLHVCGLHDGLHLFVQKTQHIWRCAQGGQDAIPLA